MYFGEEAVRPGRQAAAHECGLQIEKLHKRKQKIDVLYTFVSVNRDSFSYAYLMSYWIDINSSK